MTHTALSQAAEGGDLRGVRSAFTIVWMFAAIVLCLLTLASYSFGLLSTVRAYVGG